MEIQAPVWALRCLGGTSGERRGRPPGRSTTSRDDTGETKDKRWLISLFELFEQLSSGQVTPLELTDRKPLSVYVHQGEDDAWGLYCSSRQTVLALLMRQACVRNELLSVKCIIRPKDDRSYWGWQWSTFHDGGDGLSVGLGGGRHKSVPIKDRMDSMGSPSSSQRSSLRDGSSFELRNASTASAGVTAKQRQRRNGSVGAGQVPVRGMTGIPAVEVEAGEALRDGRRSSNGQVGVDSHGCPAGQQQWQQQPPQQHRIAGGVASAEGCSQEEPARSFHVKTGSFNARPVGVSPALTDAQRREVVPTITMELLANSREQR